MHVNNEDSNRPQVPVEEMVAHDLVAPQIEAAPPVTPAFEGRRTESRNRIIIGAGMLAAAAAVTLGIASGSAEDHRVEYDVSYSPTAQAAVNSVDKVLIEVGKITFPLSIAAVAAVKLGSRRNSKLRAMDRESSQELSDDGTRKKGRSRKVLSAIAAGTMPAVATGAVGLAAFTEAISTEVGTGPNRPIEKIFDEIAPAGTTLIVGFEGAMPMVESSVSRGLVGSVRQEAVARGVDTTILAQNLGQMTFEGEDRSDLVLGFQQLPDSELAWNASNGCLEPIPVSVDEAADIPVGSEVLLNGTPAIVVDTIEGTSAINRIGVVMDREAMATCLAKNPESPDHAVLLDTDVETAEEILASANTTQESSAVITEQRYLENSEKFWEANVKPITNVLALVSGAVAIVSMAGIMSSRLLRNRRELAAKMAAGVSDNYLRATELLRATKDGIVASVAGTAIAAASTPMANALASGFHASIGLREIAVGFAVGTVGSVGGALARLVRLRKTINPSESTRV